VRRIPTGKWISLIMTPLSFSGDICAQLQMA
jgi:hypothetical protein